MHINYYVSLIKSSLRISFLTFAEYPLDTTIWIISMLLREIVGFIGIILITANLGALNDWGLYKITLLFSMCMMVESLSQCFFDSVWNIGSMIRKGHLDIYLTRPVPVFFQLLTSRIMLQSLISFLVAVILFIYSWLNLDYIWNIKRSIFFIEFLFCGLVINSCTYWSINSINFWIIQGNDISVLIQNLREFAKYPLNIFSKFIQALLTYIIPFGFVGYYPALYLMGETTLWIVNSFLDNIFKGNHSILHR